jgi:hypothetical protein
MSDKTDGSILVYAYTGMNLWFTQMMASGPSLRQHSIMGFRVALEGAYSFLCAECFQVLKFITGID